MRNRIVFSAILLIVSVTNAVILLPGKIENAVRADAIASEKYFAKKSSIEKKRQKIKEKFSLKANDSAKNVLLAAPESVSATNDASNGAQEHEELQLTSGDDAIKSDPFNKGPFEVKQPSQRE